MIKILFQSEAGRIFKQDITARVLADIPELAEYDFDDALEYCINILNNPQFQKTGSYSEIFSLNSQIPHSKPIVPLQDTDIFRTIGHTCALFSALISLELQLINSFNNKDIGRIIGSAEHIHTLAESLTVYSEEMIRFFARIIAEGPNYFEGLEMQDYLDNHYNLMQKGGNGQASIDQMISDIQRGYQAQTFSMFLENLISNHHKIIHHYDLCANAFGVPRISAEQPRRTVNIPQTLIVH